MATPPPPKMPAPPKKPVAPWRLKVGNVNPWLLAAASVAMLLQAYLGGVSVFGGGEHADTHEAFGSISMHLLPLFLIIFGFLGADWRVGVVGIILLVLVSAQYFLINSGNEFVKALHIGNWVVIFAMVFGMLMRRLPWAPRGPTQVRATTNQPTRQAVAGSTHQRAPAAPSARHPLAPKP